MYTAHALLPTESDFTTGELTARLKPLLPGYVFSHTGDQALATAGEWQFRIWINSEPSVATEAAGMVARIAGLEPADIAVAENCTRRVEIWSEDNDPTVEHLAEYQTIVSTLKTFPGLVVLDPKEPALL